MLIAETPGCVCSTLQKMLHHDYKMTGLCPFSRAGYGSGALFITASNNTSTFLSLSVLDYCQVWLPHSLKQRSRCQ